MGRAHYVVRLLLAGIVLGALAFTACPARADSASLNPRVFRIAASHFPWPTKKLLDARIEGNDQAGGDAIVIYDAVSSGLPTWADLNRQTGWYEDALMRRGKANPAVILFVSQYASAADAQKALQAEQSFQSYRPLTSSLHLGDESYEYASSSAVIYASEPSIVDDIVICTRIQNVELDVAVFDVHAPKYHWFRSYEKAALRLAGQLAAVGSQALSTP
jgi:hypothetical protein